MRAIALLAALLTAACGGSDDDDGGGACTAASATATTSVQLTANAFVPACVRVAPGETVTFTNVDAMAHTVTADAGQAETFDSGAVAPGAAYQRTFGTPGAVYVHCTLHPMRATIVVAAPGAGVETYQGALERAP